MHTVHLRLEYGPKEQNALPSLQLTMHSLFLWAPHFQEIQLHYLTATVSREISKDGLSWSITISTSGLQAFTGWHWPAACVSKVGPSISKPAEETSSLSTNSLKSLEEDACTTRGCSRELQEDCPVPVASSCCFVTVHHPPSPAFHSHPTVLLGPDLASTGPKGKTFWGGFLINPKGLSCSSLFSTKEFNTMLVLALKP